MKADQQTYERAASASLVGLAVQVLVATSLLLLALWSQNEAVVTATWYAFGGVALWVVLWLVYQQHRLERAEALEAEQLAQRHGTESSIFETHADDLSVARRRLEALYRWALPAVSVITSLYLVGAGAYLFWSHGGAWAGALQEPPTVAERSSPLGVAFLMGGIAFVSFLVSRYVAGMGRQADWRLLRGGASYLMGVALVSGALTVAFLMMAGFAVDAAVRVMEGVIPAVMLLVGVEIALNFLLNLYRPRRRDEAPRPAFDSRFLSLLTAPESIGATISEAINYQFGFEITRSWFWQLLSRVFGRLVVLAVVVLVALSSLVIVQPDEQALLRRFGQLTGEPLQPGLHLKLPWPIESAQRFDVERIRRMSTVSAGEAHDHALLWEEGQEPGEHHHHDEEELLIVAPPRELRAETILEELEGAELERTARRAPSVAVIHAEVEIHYRIHPDRLIEYVRANIDARHPLQRDRRLNQLAQRITSRHMLRHDVDQWVGRARIGAGAALREQIQEEADAMGLGVEILNVAVGGIHPPHDVADAFHALISAELQREALVERGRQEAIRILSGVAGTLDQAERYLRELDRLEALREGGAEPHELTEQEQRIERLVRDGSGEAAIKLAEARAYRWERENEEHGQAQRFLGRLSAFRNAPDLYRMEYMFDIMGGTLPRVRKFLLSADHGNLRIWGDFKDVERGFDMALDELERD